MVPAKHWAMIDGRPIVLLYSAAFATNYDQSVIDFTKQQFAREFSGRVPYIAPEVSWKVKADNQVAWGGALGLKQPGISSLGPGYDHTAVRDRSPLIVDRRGGEFYEEQWLEFLKHPSNFVVLETWNEFHEGTDIAESREYGRHYIDLTRKYVERFKAGAKPSTGRFYRNPVISSPSMADPHVLRVGRKYYLYPTSHTKGYDVYVSKDLVKWTYHGAAYEDSRGGAWAPDVFRSKRDDEKCYLYYTVNNPQASVPPPLNKQIGVAVADSPLGPFEDRGVLVADAIDAHMFEDADGKLYLYYANLKNGFKIMVQPMLDPLTPQGRATEVLRPTESWEQVSGAVTEGPFMLKRDDTYYLMYSGTGADSPNYAIGYATAKSPLGPFAKYAGNPIVQQTVAVLGPGHHSIAQGPSGGLWMLYHQKLASNTGYRRFIALDKLWFDESGVIHARATRGTDELAP
jgi:GH43 family beta-xylosidase